MIAVFGGAHGLGDFYPMPNNPSPSIRRHVDDIRRLMDIVYTASTEATRNRLYSEVHVYVDGAAVALDRGQITETQFILTVEEGKRRLFALASPRAKTQALQAGIAQPGPPPEDEGEPAAGAEEESAAGAPAWLWPVLAVGGGLAAFVGLKRSGAF